MGDREVWGKDKVPVCALQLMVNCMWTQELLRLWTSDPFLENYCSWLNLLLENYRQWEEI